MLFGFVGVNKNELFSLGGELKRSSHFRQIHHLSPSRNYLDTSTEIEFLDQEWDFLIKIDLIDSSNIFSSSANCFL